MIEYTFSDAIKEFQKLFEKALSSRNPVRIVNSEGKSVVLLSEEDFSAMEGTFYLLKNPYNAEHILKAVKEKGYKYNSIKDLKDEISY